MGTRFEHAGHTCLTSNLDLYICAGICSMHCVWRRHCTRRKRVGDAIFSLFVRFCRGSLYSEYKTYEIVWVIIVYIPTYIKLLGLLGHRSVVYYTNYNKHI